MKPHISSAEVQRDSLLWTLECIESNARNSLLSKSSLGGHRYKRRVDKLKRALENVVAIARGRYEMDIVSTCYRLVSGLRDETDGIDGDGI